MGAALLGSLFAHKAWANEELFVEVGKLDPAAHAAERHAAIRVLNHVHVVDRIFAAHLTGQAHAHKATNTPETPTLEALARDVQASDRWFEGYVDTLTSDALAEDIAFAFTDGDRGRMSREEMLAHVVTHGSYHRGAVGRILTQAGLPPPRDLFTAYLHRAEPQRRAQG
jgi:uncharacterized damage-inducible protein DinB